MASLAAIKACLTNVFRTESIISMIAMDVAFLNAIDAEWTRGDDTNFFYFDINEMNVQFRARRNNNPRQACLGSLTCDIMTPLTYRRIYYQTLAGSYWLQFNEDYSSFKIFTNQRGHLIHGGQYHQRGMACMSSGLRGQTQMAAGSTYL